MEPIGIVQSCFTEKFGVPRQSLMVSEGLAIIKLNAHPDLRTATSQLEAFSHIWVVFLFHKNGGSWHPVIDTPRIGVAKEVGVFASRSPHRPNPIGLSAVKLERIDREVPGGVEIHISGVDILDGTPVLDIKPYLPYADSIPGANAGWAKEEITRYPVAFSDSARQFLLQPHLKKRHPRIESLIVQMLEWDPRPTSQRRAYPMETGDALEKRFAFRVLDIDVHWRIEKGAPLVVELRDLQNIITS